MIKITKLKMTTVILLNRSVGSDVSDDEDDVILLEVHEPIDNNGSLRSLAVFKLRRLRRWT